MRLSAPELRGLTTRRGKRSRVRCKSDRCKFRAAAPLAVVEADVVFVRPERTFPGFEVTAPGVPLCWSCYLDAVCDAGDIRLAR